MRRLTVWLAAIAMAWGTGTAVAADPLGVPRPAVELRAKSVRDLGGGLAHMMQVLDQEEAAKQITVLIKLFEDNAKGFEGIDLKKPIGGYVAISENVADSAVVVMIPIANEEAFLSLLSDKGKLTPKKLDGGAYSVEVPNFPFPVFFRIADDYLYATIRSEKGIDKKMLLTPAKFFTEKETVALSLKIFGDRIPDDLKQAAYGQIEKQLTEAAKEARGDEIQKKGAMFLVDQASEIAKVLLIDTKDITISADINPKTDDFTFDLVVTPKADTLLSKTLHSWSDRPSRVSAIGNAKDPIIGLGVNFALPKGTTEKLTKLYLAAVEAGLEDAIGDELALKKDLFNTLLPTVKTGDIQLGGTFTRNKDRYVVVSGAGIKEATGLIKLLKKVAAMIPAVIASFEFDKETVNGFNWHHFELPEEFTKDSHGLFGSTGWIANTDDIILFGLSKNEDLKAVTAEKTVPSTRMLSLEVSLARLALANSIGSGEKATQKRIETMIADKFGKEGPIGKDKMRLTASGGKDFRLHFDMKVQSFPFLNPSKSK